jgi:ATP-binding cassette, subfamily B, bacterial
MGLLKRLFAQARPYWGNLIVLLALGLLTTPLALLAPLPLKIVVDNVINEKPLTGFVQAIVPSWATGSSTSLLVYAVILLLAVTLISELASLVSYVLSTFTGEKLILGFRVRLFEHVQRLSLGYHDSRGTADSTYRIQYDAAAVQNVALNGLTPFISAGVMFVAMLYVTAKIDWELALIALVVSPILAGLTEIKRRRLRQGWKDAKRLESSSFAVVQEVLTSLRVVKAFGQEDRERDRFADRSSESVRKKISLSFIDGSISLVFAMTTALGTGAVLFVGARNVQSGTLTLGSLLLVMGYLVQMYTPLTQIAKSITQLQSSLASAERAFTTLDEQPAVGERPNARSITRARGAVCFREVSFGYSADRVVLSGVSFDVPAGARVGISGFTGAGKTTLVNLLTRFYDPDAGTVLLDGVDLRDYKLRDLRRQFAIVLQEPVLFST